MLLVHVIGRQDAWLHPERTIQLKITFHIHDIDKGVIIHIQPKPRAFHRHHDSKPFPVVSMTEHSGIRQIGPEILGLSVILLTGKAENRLAERSRGR